MAQSLLNISIHALREEGDDVKLSDGSTKTISIHALREEGDLLPSVLLPGSHYFYPRPPRGGRLGHAAAHIVGSEISIHALREEGDRLWSTNAIRRVRFLSTPSARRATIMYHTG